MLPIRQYLQRLPLFLRTGYPSRSPIRAQTELDSVIGTGRLPGFEDRPRLPYVEAIYRELLRWRPPTMLGLFHTNSEDDVYRGYFIPKGK